jgi:hypothetical protein
MVTLKQLTVGIILAAFTCACAAYDIEASKKRSAADFIGKSTNKKQQQSAKKIFKGYEVINKKGERVGYVSKNQNCSVVMNLTEEGIKSDSESKNTNNIEHLNFQCGSSRKEIGKDEENK